MSETVVIGSQADLDMLMAMGIKFGQGSFLGAGGTEKNNGRNQGAR